MFTCKKQTAQASQTKNSPVTPAHVLEEHILKRSGLELYKELHIFDVPIDFVGENYIHTYRCGDQNKETLVLIHGYGGSSVLYFPMLKELCKKYRVFCIDLLGMGLSSKTGFKCTNTEETIDYFVDSIEKWREALGLESFYLAGHSFGGYMSIQYSLKYQERVKKLLLLSPVGITKQEKVVTVEEILKNMSWFRKRLFKFILGFWESKTPPGEYYRNHSILGNFLLKQYMNRQFNSNGQDAELADSLFKFFSEVLKMENGSDKAIFYILKPPRVTAIIPLEELITQELEIPISCYYGDRDWMDKTGARRIEVYRGKGFQIKQIENSGHQITMHNPVALAQELLLEVAA